MIKNHKKQLNFEKINANYLRKVNLFNRNVVFEYFSRREKYEFFNFHNIYILICSHNVYCAYL